MIGVLTAPSTLADVVGIQIESPVELFLGALAATAVGGVMIGSCRRIIALALVACGTDIEATWLDEVLGILAGALLLWHFGNEPIAIVLFALSDLAPQLAEVALQRAGARHRAARPANTVAVHS